MRDPQARNPVPRGRPARMRGRDASALAVVTENRPQSCRGQRLPTVRALGHYELRRRFSLRPLRQQMLHLAAASSIARTNIRPDGAPDSRAWMALHIIS